MARLVVCFVLLLAGSGLSLVAPKLIAHAIDVDLATGDRAGLQVTAGVYVAVLVAILLVEWTGRLGLEIAAQGAMKSLKEEVFDHLLGHDLALVDRHTSGRLITRVQGDTDALRVLFAEVLLSTPADVALVIGMLVVLGLQAPGLVWVPLAVIPLYALAMGIYRRVAPPATWPCARPRPTSQAS